MDIREIDKKKRIVKESDNIFKKPAGKSASLSHIHANIIGPSYVIESRVSLA